MTTTQVPMDFLHYTPDCQEESQLESIHASDASQLPSHNHHEAAPVGTKMPHDSSGRLEHQPHATKHPNSLSQPSPSRIDSAQRKRISPSPLPQQDAMSHHSTPQFSSDPQPDSTFSQRARISSSFPPRSPFVLLLSYLVIFFTLAAPLSTTVSASPLYLSCNQRDSPRDFKYCGLSQKEPCATFMYLMNYIVPLHLKQMEELQIVLLEPHCEYNITCDAAAGGGTGWGEELENSRHANFETDFSELSHIDEASNSIRTHHHHKQNLSRAPPLTAQQKSLNHPISIKGIQRFSIQGNGLRLNFQGITTPFDSSSHRHQQVSGTSSPPNYRYKSNPAHIRPQSTYISFDNIQELLLNNISFAMQHMGNETSLLSFHSIKFLELDNILLTGIHSDKSIHLTNPLSHHSSNHDYDVYHESTAISPQKRLHQLESTIAQNPTWATHGQSYHIVESFWKKHQSDGAAQDETGSVAHNVPSFSLPRDPSCPLHVVALKSVDQFLLQNSTIHGFTDSFNNIFSLNTVSHVEFNSLYTFDISKTTLDDQDSTGILEMQFDDLFHSFTLRDSIFEGVHLPNGFFAIPTVNSSQLTGRGKIKVDNCRFMNVFTSPFFEFYTTSFEIVDSLVYRCGLEHNGFITTGTLKSLIMRRNTFFATLGNIYSSNGDQLGVIRINNPKPALIENSEFSHNIFHYMILSTHSLTFENCFFSDNVNSALNSSLNGGSIVIMFARDDTVYIQARFESCYFLNNRAVEAGAIQGVNNANISVYDSVFYKNYGRNGGAIRIDNNYQYHSMLYLYNTTFDENVSETHSGAVSCEDGGAVFLYNNTRFLSNYHANTISQVDCGRCKVGGDNIQHICEAQNNQRTFLIYLGIIVAVGSVCCLSVFLCVLFGVGYWCNRIFSKRDTNAANKHIVHEIFAVDEGASERNISPEDGPGFRADESLNSTTRATAMDEQESHVDSESTDSFHRSVHRHQGNIPDESTRPLLASPLQIQHR